MLKTICSLNSPGPAIYIACFRFTTSSSKTMVADRPIENFPVFQAYNNFPVLQAYALLCNNQNYRLLVRYLQDV